MNTTLKNILIAVAVVAVGLASGYLGATHGSKNLSGNNVNYPVSFDAGIRVNNAYIIDSNGGVSTTAFTLGNSGTQQSLYQCQSSNLDVAAYAATTTFSGNVTTTQVSFSGALATDRCTNVISGNAATGTVWRTDCAVYGAGTSTLRAYNLAIGATDPGVVSSTMCIYR